MITQASTNQKFVCQFQVDPVDISEFNAYTGSDCGLRLTRQDDQKLSLYHFDVYGSVGGTVTLIYASPVMYSDPSGVLEIQMRNVIRECSAKTGGDIDLNIYLNETDGTAVDSASFSLHVFPGVSYNDLPMPRAKDAPELGAEARDVVLPPNVVIVPPLAGVPIVIECSIADYDHATVTNTYNGQTITPGGARGNQIAYSRQNLQNPSGPRGIRLDQLTRSRSYVFEDAPACADLVLVSWTSLTGAYRKHVFPVVSFGRDWEGERLVSVGDGILTEKNAVTTLSCRLTGLTAYGYWYYIDLLTASDVHAVPVSQYSGAVQVNTAILSPFSAATVEGGSAATPVGNGFYNFDFTLKLRHYDSY